MILRIVRAAYRRHSNPLGIAALLLASFTPALLRAQATSTPSFEFVSIRTTAADTGWSYKESPDTMELAGVTARVLVADAFAYDTANVIGGPSWIDATKYIVKAKFDPSVAARLGTLSYKERMNQIFAMLQPVLAERFALKSHSESKEVRMYALLLAKGRPKFGPAPASPTADEQQEGPASYNGRQWIVNREPMSFLALQLSRIPEIGGNVIDQTGLKGDYKFTFSWSAKSDPDITVFKAIEEQLGLKLKPTKGSVDVLAIDYITSPSEN
jgi:uncharacterized protein (TIGR03435 family)